MKWYRADLHVHSVLSPCAEIEMTPRCIVEAAQKAGIEILAIADHNAGENVGAAMRAAQGNGVTVLPAMEVETQEEIHLLAIFDTLHQLSVWTREIEQYRVRIRNDERRFGAQLVVDEFDELLRVEENLLITALQITADYAAKRIQAIGGLVIASHVDRPTYSILKTLGFIPPQMPLDALEVVSAAAKDSALMMAANTSVSFPAVSFSDAHTLEALLKGNKTRFYISDPTVGELRLALAGKEGRRFVIEWASG